jgi:hypothetical protein
MVFVRMSHHLKFSINPLLVSDYCQLYKQFCETSCFVCGSGSGGSGFIQSLKLKLLRGKITNFHFVLFNFRNSIYNQHKSRSRGHQSRSHGRIAWLRPNYAAPAPPHFVSNYTQNVGSQFGIRLKESLIQRTEINNC